MELKKISDEPTIKIAIPLAVSKIRESLFYHKGQEKAVILFYEEFFEMVKDQKD